MATRILSAWYLTGQDRDFPKTNFAPVDYPWPEADEVNNKHVDVQHDHHKVIRAVGAASHVLLKNEGHILPLQRGLRNLILIGSGESRPLFDSAPQQSDTHLVACPRRRPISLRPLVSPRAMNGAHSDSLSGCSQLLS